MPNEIANELAELFGMHEQGSAKLTIHAERVAWLSQHLNEVLKWLEIPTDEADRWEVTPIAVANKEVPSLFLGSKGMRIMTFRQLLDDLVDKE
jgi:hypothetical protein